MDNMAQNLIDQALKEEPENEGDKDSDSDDKEDVKVAAEQLSEEYKLF